jgi:hypothetical protein
MIRGWRRVLPLVVVSAVACVGCKKDEPSSSDGDGSGEPGKRKRAPARVEAITLEELDEQPGLLADGAIFAAVRAGTAQDFLRQIPLPGEVTRELAEARRELGFDPLTDDVLARFAIPPDAVVSMTLGRPIGSESRKAVAKGIHRRDDRFLGLVARVLNEGPAGFGLAEPSAPKPFEPIPVPMPVEPAPPMPEAPSSPLPPAKPIVFSPPVEVAVPAPVVPLPTEEPPPPIAPEIVPPVPPVPPEIGTLYDPLPPPISPAERSEIDELLRQADAMALQFRFHIPSDDPSKIFGELRTRMEPRMLTQGDALCRGLEVEVCVGGGKALLIARREGKAAVLDMVVFTGSFDEQADVEARRGAAAEAVKARRSELPALAKMAGHASAYVDAQALVELVEHELVGSALRNLAWDTAPAEGIDRRMGEAEQLRRLLEAPRLFDGLLANAHHERDRTQLQITWPLREDQEALARSTLAPPPLVVPVPSLAGLCDGALLCARSRGLPSPQEIGTKLGMGLYGNAELLDDALEATDEAGAALLLVSTWPNALGTLLWHMPIAEARGPEAALARGLLDAVSRIGGLGLGVRRIDVGRGSLFADYAAYARVPVNDLSLVSTLLTMAELRLTPTTVEGVAGRVSMLRIPEDDVPAVLMTREDPDTVANAEGKEVRYGWLTIVDGPDRLGWLLGLPTDDGQEPLLYGEIPDLWRLAASVPEAVDELGFARTWATERSFKAALRLDDGQPHLLMEVAMRPTDAEPAKG